MVGRCQRVSGQDRSLAAKSATGSDAGGRMPNDDLKDFAELEEIAIKVDQRELPHSPGLVFDSFHSWDSFRREQCGAQLCVQAVYLGHADVAAGVTVLGLQIWVWEEVQFDSSKRQDGIPVTDHFADEAELLVEGDGSGKRAAWQRGYDFCVGVHDLKAGVSDCPEKKNSRVGGPLATTFDVHVMPRFAAARRARAA
jgi:hypothetical protein